ncbi:transcription factor bHLH160 isoform X1 [Vitis riparia]|uniref:transcription factor bHLH160 isoform X1 n=1 Tax=Vitis riparia TaxID=96939 RepID=UPI00155A13C6|nr:transcription factor bHLH160 isoform X1 [Vitis riparia]
MSSPPFNNPHYEDNSCPSLHYADLWSLLQEIDISVPVDDHNSLDRMDPIMFEQENSAMVQYSSQEKGLVGDNPINPVAFDQENSTMVQSSKEKGQVGGKTNLKTSERNRRIKHSQAKKTLLKHIADQQGSSVIRKENHNAKERVRRMQLNASYLALRSLLPDARRSKKRWSSPRIIDRVLEYIPELENEIENLTLKKDNMLSSLANEQTHQNQPSDLQVPTVSVTEVRKDEVIVQICMQREPGNVLSNLMQNVEGEGMGIMSASSLYVCDERICYHLHIQMNGSSDGDDYKAHLKHKVISWLC